MEGLAHQSQLVPGSKRTNKQTVSYLPNSGTTKQVTKGIQSEHGGFTDLGTGVSGSNRPSSSKRGSTSTKEEIGGM